MDQTQLWDVVSGIIFVFYTAATIEYFSRILEFRKKHWLINVFFGILNFVGVEIFILLDYPVEYQYLAFFLVIFIEVVIISKSPLSQIVYGISVLMLHIAAIHILSLVIASNIMNITTYELIHTRIYYMQVNAVVFTGLSIILIVFQRIINIEYIKKISSSKIYANIMSAEIFLLFIYMFYDIQVVFQEEAPIGLIFPTIANIFFALSLFYCFLLYTIYFIDMSPYLQKLLQIEEKFGEIETKRVEVEEQISRDALTEFFNKDYIEATIEYICVNNEDELTILFIDMNGLKYVNDLYGHDVGDKYILAVANTIKNCVDEKDVVARVGGDEFIVILFESNPYRIKEVIDTIHTLLEASEKSHRIPMSVSIGDVIINQEMKNKGIQAILNLADHRMRMVKEKYYEEVNVSHKE